MHVDWLSITPWLAVCFGIYSQVHLWLRLSLGSNRYIVDQQAATYDSPVFRGRGVHIHDFWNPGSSVADQDVGGALVAAIMYTDITGALVNIKGIPVSASTNHSGVRYGRVRGEVERGAVDDRFVSTQSNPADMFIKLA
jgi:hypothetical protein